MIMELCFTRRRASGLAHVRFAAGSTSLCGLAFNQLRSKPRPGSAAAEERTLCPKCLVRVRSAKELHEPSTALASLLGPGR